MMTTNKAMLQQISDVAWLVHQGEQRLGILNKDVQEQYTYITGKEVVKFKGEDEVRDHFGNVYLFEERINEPAQKQDSYYIKGFEINYPEPFILDTDHPDYNKDVPLFTKIEDSDVYYAAGYYCINYGKGWKHASAPKFGTLEKYGYEGPFKTELDARQRMRQLNKQKRAK